MNDIECPGSRQPIVLERGRQRAEGLCPRCGHYVVVYTPTPGIPDWHATVHDATAAELRKHKGSRP